VLLYLLDCDLQSKSVPMIAPMGGAKHTMNVYMYPRSAIWSSFLGHSHQTSTTTVECFQIDKASAQMIEPRMRILQEQNISAHEQLFQDAIRRQARKQEYGSWYPDEATFQPAVAGRPATAGCLQRPKQRPSCSSASRSACSTSRSSIQAHQRLYSHHRMREVCSLLFQNSW
jgi:hypothetical protein